MMIGMLSRRHVLLNLRHIDAVREVFRTLTILKGNYHVVFHYCYRSGTGSSRHRFPSLHDFARALTASGWLTTAQREPCERR